ncbi:MAG: TIGR01777 family protein [Candidatus Hydrogenedentota bacterium]|nr:MAG: TIGR01777 family protein [Candidatus Hydrogenedentota bacterium]
MDVLIAGASGLIGKALMAAFQADGCSVRTLVRRDAQSESELFWDPVKGTLDWPDGYSPNTVICLSGANVAGKRWSSSYKQEILDSRVRSVSLLAKTIAALPKPPSLFVTASAVGIYGSSRGDELLTEESSKGADFLADVCQQWETAAQPAVDAGIRTVHLRFGIVLAKTDGALKKMLLPFRLGLGGPIGSGQQYMSWVTLDEAVNIARFVVQHDTIHGPVNAVAPEAVTNRTFTRSLGMAIHRPTVFPLPAVIVKAMMGEMGEALLLGSTRAVPEKLLDAGYTFQSPALREALSAVLSS